MRKSLFFGPFPRNKILKEINADDCWLVWLLLRTMLIALDMVD